MCCERRFRGCLCCRRDVTCWRWFLRRFALCYARWIGRPRLMIRFETKREDAIWQGEGGARYELFCMTNHALPLLEYAPSHPSPFHLLLPLPPLHPLGSLDYSFYSAISIMRKITFSVHVVPLFFLLIWVQRSTAGGCMCTRYAIFTLAHIHTVTTPYRLSSYPRFGKTRRDERTSPLREQGTH